MPKLNQTSSRKRAIFIYTNLEPQGALCVLSQTFRLSYICFGPCVGVVYVLLSLLYRYYYVILSVVLLLLLLFMVPTHYIYILGKKGRERIRKGKTKETGFFWIGKLENKEKRCHHDVLGVNRKNREFVLWVRSEICF